MASLSALAHARARPPARDARVRVSDLATIRPFSLALGERTTCTASDDDDFERINHQSARAGLLNDRPTRGVMSRRSGAEDERAVKVPSRGTATRVRDARATLENAFGECEGRARARRARNAARGDDGDDRVLRDLEVVMELIEKMRAMRDDGLVRAALTLMDGLKAALRMSRESEDEARREVCVAALFGLSRLATAEREEMIRAGLDGLDGDGLLETLRVHCKAPGLSFEERMQSLKNYVETVGKSSRRPPALDIHESSSSDSERKGKKVVGGLARAFASRGHLGEDVCTPEMSDDEAEVERGNQLRALGSLCASPSKIFYAPEIVSGKGASVDDTRAAPVGDVICRICEQPIPAAQLSEHTTTCAGYRPSPSSYDSSEFASPRISGTIPSPGAADETSDQVSIDDFRIIKLISGGAYGRVFLAQKRTTRDLFAVKAMRKDDLVYKNMIDQVVAERDALIKAANPFTIKLYYSFTSARHVYLVTEYANGGDLYSLLKQLGRLSEDHARQYCAEITLALEYVHSKGITHRDLKPGNCLIASDGHVKLADFGLSRMDRDIDYNSNGGEYSPDVFDGGSPVSHSSASVTIKVPGTREQLHTSSPIHRMTLLASTSKSPQQSPARKVHSRSSASWHGSGAKGTPDYLAPEILLCEPCGAGVDWWALGVMAYELVVGTPPFNASTPLAIFSKVIDGNIEWPNGECEFSEAYAHFVESLLVHDVEARLGARSADDVKAHEWFRTIEWDRVYDGTAASVFVPKPVDLQDTSYFIPASDMRQEYPTGRARRMSESSRRTERASASAESMSMNREDTFLEPTQGEMDDSEDDEDMAMRAFTYRNLAELALRNVDMSTPSAPMGLPRRGSVGKDLSNVE